VSYSHLTTYTQLIHNIEEKLELLDAKFEYPAADRYVLKLKEEAEELYSTPEDLTEIADCFICLLGVARKSGYNIHLLLGAIDHKIDVNLSRTFVRQADGTFKHVD